MMTASDKKLLSELSVMLVIKLCLLFLLWFIFFSNPIPAEDANDITQIRIQAEQGENH